MLEVYGRFADSDVPYCTSRRRAMRRERQDCGAAAAKAAALSDLEQRRTRLFLIVVWTPVEAWEK